MTSLERATTTLCKKKKRITGLQQVALASPRTFLSWLCNIRYCKSSGVIRVHNIPGGEFLEKCEQDVCTVPVLRMDFRLEGHQNPLHVIPYSMACNIFKDEVIV